MDLTPAPTASRGNEAMSLVHSSEDASAPRKGSGSGSEPRYSFRTITPATALKMLREHGPLTREPDPIFVQAYAASMRAGRWILNGMPIIFGTSGRLLDGGMRLKACVEADASFRTLVVENVPDDILHTLDQHRRRSYVGVLQARGIPRPRHVVNLMTKLIRYDLERLEKPYRHISWMRLDRILHTNRKDLLEAINQSFSGGAREETYFDHTLHAALAFMGNQVNPKATARFLDAVQNPSKHSSTEPGRLIADRLAFERDSPAKTRPNDLFALCIKALADTINGTHQKRYRYVSKKLDPKKGEDFPKLPGYSGLAGPIQDGDRWEGYGLVQVDSLDKHRPSVVTEEISPTTAHKYLTHNLGNRKIVKSHIDMIARDIKNDNWRFNATPICFAHTGRMMNGQHRLYACIEADAPIECTVVRGLEEEAFHTYDVQVRRRSFLGPNTGISEASDERVLTAAAKLVWKQEHSGADTYAVKPSTSEILDVLKRHPMLAGSVMYGRRVSHLGQASLMTFIHYHISHGPHKTLADEFLEKLDTGADLSKGSTLLTLRNKLMSIRSSATVMHRTDVLRIIMNGWDAFVAEHSKSPRKTKAKPKTGSKRGATKH